MQSFSDFTDRLIELPDDEIEQLDEINLKRAVAPADALAFAFRKSKQVRQKLQNAKSSEELEDKLNELTDALAITDSKMNAIFTMLLFLSKRVQLI